MAVLSIGFIACNNSRKSQGKEIALLQNKYWRLTELNGQAITNDGKETPEIFLVLYSDGNRAAGNAGCNRFSGEYELGDNGFIIRFGALIHTEMACAALETEQAMLKVLESADSYYVTDSTLQLNKAKMAPLARYVAVKNKAIN